MANTENVSDVSGRVRQALALWIIFFATAVLLNGTIPFALGADVRAWTASFDKNLLFHAVIYGILFLLVPLLLSKGWRIVRQPAFLVPLLIALVAIAVRPLARESVFVVVPVLAFLHWRFDLSDLGFRSRGWVGDLIAIILMALLYASAMLLRPVPFTFAIDKALLAGLDRWFANPASTTENLFYFGFLTERLVPRFGRWLTPLMIGLMYTAHEMSNPEYWYGGMSFALTFIGIAATAAIYVWRRNIIVIWLGDGLGKMAGRLF